MCVGGGGRKRKNTNTGRWKGGRGGGRKVGGQGCTSCRALLMKAPHYKQNDTKINRRPPLPAPLGVLSGARGEGGAAPSSVLCRKQSRAVAVSQKPSRRSRLTEENTNILQRQKSSFQLPSLQEAALGTWGSNQESLRGIFFLPRLERCILLFKINVNAPLVNVC